MVAQLGDRILNLAPVVEYSTDSHTQISGDVMLVYVVGPQMMVVV